MNLTDLLTATTATLTNPNGDSLTPGIVSAARLLATVADDCENMHLYNLGATPQLRLGQQ